MTTQERQFRFYRLLVTTMMTLFVAAAIGCNERGNDRILHESNLRIVAVLYSQYLSAHANEAPRDEDAFREFVASLGPGVLERAGLSGLDELLVSTRDGKPFSIKYKSEQWPLEGAIAYEQEGVGGTRYIATEQGGVSEITEEQFLKRLQEASTLHRLESGANHG